MKSEDLLALGTSSRRLTQGHGRLRRYAWFIGWDSCAGPLIAVGPIMAALPRVGAGSAVGGFTGALIGLGIPNINEAV
jgi:hypothetical protein